MEPVADEVVTLTAGSSAFFVSFPISVMVFFIIFPVLLFLYTVIPASPLHLVIVLPLITPVVASGADKNTAGFTFPNRVAGNGAGAAALVVNLDTASAAVDKGVIGYISNG